MKHVVPFYTEFRGEKWSFWGKIFKSFLILFDRNGYWDAVSS